MHFVSIVSLHIMLACFDFLSVLKETFKVLKKELKQSFFITSRFDRLESITYTQQSILKREVHIQGMASISRTGSLVNILKQLLQIHCYFCLGKVRSVYYLKENLFSSQRSTKSNHVFCYELVFAIKSNLLLHNSVRLRMLSMTSSSFCGDKQIK